MFNSEIFKILMERQNEQQNFIEMSNAVIDLF